MRKALIAFAVAMVLALGMTACSKETSEKASDAGKSAAQDVKEAVEDAGEAVEEATN